MTLTLKAPSNFMSKACVTDNMLNVHCFSSRSGESVYLNHVCITSLKLIPILFSLGK